MRSWVIGSSADCDLVVDSPLASGHHCQLTQNPEGFQLVDLGSTNGTHVNGQRIAAPTAVTPGESITLGRTVPMPWPAEVVRFARIGRLADNEIVLDDPRVSSHHARLIIVAGAPALLEDLGSTNGTFLNSADRAVTRGLPLAETDTVYFGSLAVPAARLLAGQRKPGAAAGEPLSAAAAMEPHPAPVGARAAFGPLVGNRWGLAVLAQAPLFAILVVLLFGHEAAAVITGASWASVAEGIASTVFALALASIWLGCSVAVGEAADRNLRQSPGGDEPANSVAAFAARIAVLAAICGAGCALLLAIVHLGSGLRGSWPALWGMLVLASLVGLLLGLVVASFQPDWKRVAAISLLSFIPMIALGGRIWPLPRMSLPVRLAAQAMPSRWAFEGMLLLESPHHPAPASAAESTADPAPDLAEEFFPARSEQMGATADGLALGFFLVGMAAVLGGRVAAGTVRRGSDSAAII
jgi:pSer/pThr/pTyr-binding forkhead associated (FHA) protein